MVEYRDVGRIALWRNKGTKPNTPIISGKLELDGREYSLSLWKSKEAVDGPIYDGKIQLKSEEHPGRRPQPPPPQTSQYDDMTDDDIPF